MAYDSNIIQMMKKKVEQWIIIAFLMLPITLCGQAVSITFSVATQRPLSRLAELQDLASSGQMILTLTNLTSVNQPFQIEAEMSSPTTSFKIVTNPNAIPSGGVLGPAGTIAGTKTYTVQELQDLFYEDSFITNDGQTLRDFFLGNPDGQIPSGNYQLCVRLRPETLNQQNTNLLSNIGCANITFQQFNPPLINSIGNQPCPFCNEITPLQDPNMPFQVAFTPPIFELNSVIVSNFSYILYIVEMSDGVLDPNQVQATLQDRNDGNFIVKSSITGTGAPLQVANLLSQDFSKPLEIGHQYAIWIRASTNSVIDASLPNNGNSQAISFTYGENSTKPYTSFTANEEDPNLPFNCLNGNCNEIQLPTGGTPATSLAVGDEVYVGCFKVKITQATKEEDGFNGTGLVRIPVFAAKFKVRLVGLKVNRFSNNVLVAIDGFAEGLKDESYPESGPIAALYNAFQTIKPQVLQATATIKNEVNQAGNTINTAVDNVANQAQTVTNVVENASGGASQLPLPTDISRILYGVSETAGNTGQAVSAVQTGVQQAVSTANQYANVLDVSANQAANTAQSAFGTIRNIDRTLQQLANEDFETGLPIGYSGNAGSEPIRIGIFGMTFTPRKATATLVVETPYIAGINNRLYFGALNVCFSPRQLSLAQSTFYLGGDLSFSLPDNHKLILKGSGSDQPNEQVTYLTLDNGNFKTIKVSGEVKLDTTTFIPKAPAKGAVTIAFNGEAVDNFDNLIFTSDVTTPFTFKDAPQWGFSLNQVALDLSTLKNPEGWESIPAVLRNGIAAEASLQNTWTGVFVKKAVVQLPRQFKIGSGTQPPSAEINGLLIGFKGRGIAFDAHVRNIMTIEGGGKLANFGVSADTLNMQMIGGEFTAFNLNGKLHFKLFDKGSAFPYRLDILDLLRQPPTDIRDIPEKVSDAIDDIPPIAFKLTLPENVDLKIEKLHTVFTLGAGCSIDFNSEGHNDDPDKLLLFKLNGKLSIIAEEDGIKMPGIGFENFYFDGSKIITDSLNVSFASPQKFVGGSGASDDDSKAGGFPISVEKFRPIFELAADGIRFGFGFDVVLNLKEGAGFGLTTGLDLTTKLSAEFEPMLDLAVDFKKISIDTDVSVSHISGSLEFIKNDATFGNGFRGCITLEMKIPAPIMGQVQGMFGSVRDNGEGFRYFYIEGFIKGLNILIPQTPIAIDGFAGGFWYNMMKVPNAPSFAARLNQSTANGACLPPPLIPSKDKLGIGLGVMVKEAASQGYSLNGVMTFEAGLTTDLAPLEITVGGAVRFLKIPGPVPENAIAISDPIKLAADVSLTYDFTQHIIAGQCNVYVNVGNVVKGTEGPDDRAGRLVMYFGGGEWYVYLGNPWGSSNQGLYHSDLSGMGRYAQVSLIIPEVGNLQSGVYFCMGTYGIRQVTELPPLDFPESVRAYLANHRPDFDPQASSGTGLAFGAYLGGNIGVETSVVTASINFGMGFDLAMVRYLTPQCGRSGDNFGINNYYATGQVYGFAKGELSITFDDDRYSLASMDLMAVATFGGPNPTWVQGQLQLDKESFTTVLKAAAGVTTGGVYTLVDNGVEVADRAWNWVTGSDEDAKGITDRIVDEVAPQGLFIDFKLGDPCSINKAASFNDRENSMPIIAAIKPQLSSGESLPSLEPVQAITVLYNKPLSQSWTIRKPDGTVLRRVWYVKSAKVVKGNGEEVPTRFVSVSSTEENYWLTPSSPLPVGVVLTFRIVMGVKEKIGNGTWKEKLSYQDGGSTEYSQEQRFKIVPVSYTLNASDIKFAYPAVDQKYFLQNHGQKFVILKKQFPELKTLAASDLTTKIYSNNELITEGMFKYRNINEVEAAIEYTTPNLPNDADIRIEFYVQHRVANASQPVGKTNQRESTVVQKPDTKGIANSITTEIAQIYRLTFHTSRFNTFADKMATLKPSPCYHQGPDSYVFTKTFVLDEDWDDFEVGTEPIYKNLYRDVWVDRCISTTKVPLNTPWHNQMKYILQTEYSAGQVLNDPSFIFRTQPLDVAYSGGKMWVTFDYNEFIRYMIRPERLTSPTAGDYTFTFDYKYPVLVDNVVQNKGVSSSATAPTATNVQQNQLANQPISVSQANNVQGLQSNYRTDERTTYTAQVHYDGMDAIVKKQQEEQGQLVRNVVRFNNSLKLKTTP